MSTPEKIDLNNLPPAPQKRRRTPSQRQLAANSANAAKSTGPRTPAGKDIAKFNALKHGLTATHVCVPGESREDYDERRRQYIELIKPANILQLELLDLAIAALWAKQRYVRFETYSTTDQVLRTRLDIAQHYNNISPNVESMLAFRTVGDDTNFLKNLERYGARATRDLRVAMQLLQEAIAMRPDSPPPAVLDSEPAAAPVHEPEAEPEPEAQPGAETAELPNEPNPISEHLYTEPAVTVIEPRISKPISTCKPMPPRVSESVELTHTRTATANHPLFFESALI
jgi:hypothetical protein